MNISKTEQRVLHLLAQGGEIRHDRGPHGRVVDILCLSRDGFGFPDCTLGVFQKLRAKRLIESRAGGPYRISRTGRLHVRARPDNR